MESYRSYVRQNPGWLDERFSSVEEESEQGPAHFAERLPMKGADVTYEDRVAQAEAYGLLPPDEEEEDEVRSFLFKNPQFRDMRRTSRAQANTN